MSQPQPTQPNQPQYQIATLDLFPVYATRAACQQATGQQAPPFDATQPIKGWANPAPSGDPYLVFDSTAAATGYVSQISLPAAQAAQLNLPGIYNYPAYVSPPTDAVEVGPYGPIGQVSPDQVCMQADAQAVANALRLYTRARPSPSCRKTTASIITCTTSTPAASGISRSAIRSCSPKVSSKRRTFMEWEPQATGPLRQPASTGSTICRSPPPPPMRPPWRRPSAPCSPTNKSFTWPDRFSTRRAPGSWNERICRNPLRSKPTISSSPMSKTCWRRFKAP